MSIKIDFSNVKDALLIRLVNDLSIEVDKNTLKEVLDKIEDTLDANLICSSCGKFLPDEAFYKQKGALSRRERASKCSTCFKEKYTRI